MVARSGVQVRGLREVIRALERYGVEAQDLKDVMERIGANVVRYVEAYAPRGATGALVGSIRASKTKNKSVVRAGGARVKYARVRNYGIYYRNTGKRIAGTRFINRASDAAKPQTIALMEEGLRDLAQKYNLTTL